MINKYRPYLIDELDMAETRAEDFERSMSILHYSIAKMDAHNLRIMWNNFSGLMEAVAEFADKNPGLNDYREWNKPESERVK